MKVVQTTVRKGLVRVRNDFHRYGDPRSNQVSLRWLALVVAAAQVVLLFALVLSRALKFPMLQLEILLVSHSSSCP